MSKDSLDSLANLIKDNFSDLPDIHLSDIFKSKEKASVLIYLLKQITFKNDGIFKDEIKESLEKKELVEKKNNFISKGPALNQKGFNKNFQNNFFDKNKNLDVVDCKIEIIDDNLSLIDKMSIENKAHIDKNNSVNEENNNEYKYLVKNKSKLEQIKNQNKLEQISNNHNFEIPDFNFIPTNQYKDKLLEFIREKNLNEPEYSSREKIIEDKKFFYSYVKVGKLVYFTIPDFYPTSEEAEFNVAKKAYFDLKENKDKYFVEELEEELLKLFIDQDEIYHGNFIAKLYQEAYDKEMPENYYEIIKDSKKIDIQKHILGNNVLTTFALRKNK